MNISTIKTKLFFFLIFLLLTSPVFPASIDRFSENLSDIQINEINAYIASEKAKASLLEEEAEKAESIRQFQIDLERQKTAKALYQDKINTLKDTIDNQIIEKIVIVITSIFYSFSVDLWITGIIIWFLFHVWLWFKVFDKIEDGIVFLLSFVVIILLNLVGFNMII